MGILKKSKAFIKKEEFETADKKGVSRQIAKYMAKLKINMVINLIRKPKCDN